MIPMSSDVAAALGEWAENIENRSLLHEKYALPKVWGTPQGIDKLNDAGRWNILRIVENGPSLLQEDANRLQYEAQGKNATPEVAQRKGTLSQVARKMASSGKMGISFSETAKAKSNTLKNEIISTYGDSAASFSAKLGARMMINMAGGVIENAGISLDRLFGLPFIPGSAVKGIARQEALWDIHTADASAKEVLLKNALLAFGYGAHDITGDFAWAAGRELASQESRKIDADELKGCIAFFPAYPSTNPKVVVDMVNPHYPRYYSGQALTAEDTESPIPNYFPAVESGAEFLFSIVALREIADVSTDDLLNQAVTWLKNAISRRGLGAKTAAGYGWFQTSLSPQNGTTSSLSAPTGPSPLLEPADELIAKWANKLNTSGNFPVALPEIVALADDVVLKKVFEAVIPENERRKLTHNPKWKNQPYWQSFLNGRHTESARKILTRLGYLT